MQFSNLSESVSVVIPGYNVGSYIEACLASVYAQTHKPREVIVVNDGSTDDTLPTLHRLQKHHPDLIVIDQPNAGGCSARNAGLRVATGKWIQFFDGDDVLLPQKLESQLSMACSEPDVNVVIGSYQEVDANLKYIRTLTEAACPDVYIAIMLSRAGRTSSQLYRRSAVIQAGGWNTSRKSSQEYDLLYRVARLGGIAKFDANAYTQLRMRAGSITHTNITANVKRILDLRTTIFEELSNEPYPFQDELKQALFEIIRLAYSYDRGHALEILNQYLPKSFIPNRNRSYAVAYKFLGIDGAERLSKLGQLLRGAA
jgi:glycosyltransferase involved in cell wall biosynthesis